MSVQTVRTEERQGHVGGAGEIGRILLGGAGGLAVGALLGAAVYQSLVTGFLGALAGAVGGLIAALKQVEAA